MKYVTYIVSAVALIMIIFNATKLDFQNLFEGESVIALICIIALLCGVCILLIYNMSKQIEDKTKE